MVVYSAHRSVTHSSPLAHAEQLTEAEQRALLEQATLAALDREERGSDISSDGSHDRGEGGGIQLITCMSTVYSLRLKTYA